MTAPAAPTATPPARGAGGQLDRRTVIAAAVILTVAIIGGVAIVAFGTREPSPAQVRKNHAELVNGPAQSIEPANSGAPPTNGGDRGGWEQLTMLALICTAIVGLGLVVFRGSKRSQAGRAAWRAAAATGVDGAVPRDPRFDPPVTPPAPPATT